MSAHSLGKPGYPHLVKAAAQLPYDLTAPSQARSVLRGTLREWSLSELLDDAEIVVSELVANAVRYGGPPVTITLERTEGNGLIIAVRDGDPSGGPLPRTAAAGDTGGRGLQLVESLSRSWGCTADATGKVVWAELGA